MKNEIQTAWSKAVNNKDNWSFKDPTYGNKVKGKLKAEQYLAYNIARGLPLERGFKEESEIFQKTVTRLVYFIGRVKPNNNLYMNRAYFDDAIQFFGETITVEDFREKADEAIRLYSNS